MNRIVSTRLLKHAWYQNKSFVLFLALPRIRTEVSPFSFIPAETGALGGHLVPRATFGIASVHRNIPSSMHSSVDLPHTSETDGKLATSPLSDSDWLKSRLETMSHIPGPFAWARTRGSSQTCSLLSALSLLGLSSQDA